MSYLAIRDLQRLFAGLAGVRAFDFTAERGEFISLLGPSGCGKTTVLRTVAGFEQPDRGTIELDGRDIAALPVNRRQIGMVFQNYALFPNMNVGDNIAFGLRIAKKPAASIPARVDEMLELIRLPGIAKRYPYQLSGGQQQRVALARALAVEPKLLLLDEPLSALDAKVRVAVREEIRAVQRRLGITTLFVTHDQQEALAISDRIVVMNEGRIEQVGTPSDVYNYPKTRFVASFVGTLNLLDARACSTPAPGRWRLTSSRSGWASGSGTRARPARSRCARRRSPSGIRTLPRRTRCAARSRPWSSWARSCAFASRSAGRPCGSTRSTIRAARSR